MSVAKMKDGKRWYVFVRWKDWSGKTLQHKKEGFERRADAKAYEQEFLNQKNGSSNMSVAALCDLYMEDCRSRLKPTTCKFKFQIIKKHILPPLGHFKVSEVSPAHIRNWQNTLLNMKETGTNQSYSPTYLRTLHSQLSTIFNFGIKYYGLKNNPCLQAGPIGKLHADSMQFWTVDEFKRFLQAISNHPVSVVAFSLLFWTGMRSGELLALTPSDFDFAAGTVSITKNYARINRQDLILEPKTPKSRRVIPLPSTLLAMTQEYISSLYNIGPEDRIFFNFSKIQMNYEMKKGCSASGVKKIRVHDLRHSHASLLIEMGFSPLLIAERLGHENIETTLQTYSHLYPNKRDELILQLESMQKCYDFATHKFS